MKGKNKNPITPSIQCPGAAPDSAEVQLEKMMKLFPKEGDLIRMLPSLNPPPAN